MRLPPTQEETVKTILCVLLPLILGSCTQIAAQATVEAGYLIDAASAIAHENHMVRQWVRAQCLEIFKVRVAKLRGEDKPDEATALLVAGYPSLITVSILKKVYKNPESILGVPFGCAMSPEGGEPGDPAAIIAEPLLDPSGDVPE